MQGIEAHNNSKLTWLALAESTSKSAGTLLLSLRIGFNCCSAFRIAFVSGWVRHTSRDANCAASPDKAIFKSVFGRFFFFLWRNLETTSRVTESCHGILHVVASSLSKFEEKPINENWMALPGSTANLRELNFNGQWMKNKIWYRSKNDARMVLPSCGLLVNERSNVKPKESNGPQLTMSMSKGVIMRRS